MGVTKLHSVFLKYVLILALAVVFVIGVNLSIYILCVNADIIYSLNSKSMIIEMAKDTLQFKEKLRKVDVPSFCNYVLFQDDGRYISGSISSEDSIEIWKLCIENNQSSDNLNLYTVIERKGEILILQYRTAAEFSNSTLNSIFPSADICLIISMILEILVLLIMVSYLFGKYLGNRMGKLLSAVQKIEQQELDFKIEKSKIIEIDRIWDAFDHLRIELKQSLIKQWRDDKSRQDQISALAHDLKTPLTIIRGNTELLLDMSLLPEQKECADYIESGSMQMQNYIQTLIEATKSWENMPLNLQEINLAIFLKELKNQVSALCSVKNIILCWNFEIDSLTFFADADLLRRVLINVFSNAVEYTPQGGKIVFDVLKKENEISFIITDTGTGFSKEALQHATEQFYMEDSSRNRKLHYGIGLYTVSNVVKKHGGKIILDNSSVFGGAKVEIVFPC